MRNIFHNAITNLNLTYDNSISNINQYICLINEQNKLSNINKIKLVNFHFLPWTVMGMKQLGRSWDGWWTDCYWPAGWLLWRYRHSTGNTALCCPTGSGRTNSLGQRTTYWTHSRSTTTRNYGCTCWYSTWSHDRQLTWTFCLYYTSRLRGRFDSLHFQSQSVLPPDSAHCCRLVTWWSRCPCFLHRLSQLPLPRCQTLHYPSLRRCGSIRDMAERCGGRPGKELFYLLHLLPLLRCLLFHQEPRMHQCDFL